MITTTTPTLGHATRLATARITRVEDGQALLQVEKDPPPAQVWATPALAHVYAPAEGDRVLVIGGTPESDTDPTEDHASAGAPHSALSTQHSALSGGGWYIIGVLETTGPTTITARGDLKLQSLTGAIDLSSPRAVNIRTPLLSITVDTLQTIARSITQTCMEALHWFKERLDVRAGRAQTIVDDVSRTKAKRFLVRAEREIKLDGDTIHLG